MFSSLPKLADKTFIIAFLVPTIAFLLALGAAFPGLISLRAPSEQGDGAKALADAASTLVDASLTVAGLWLCALGLMLVNRPLYRMLEGYFGPLKTAKRIERLKRIWSDEQTKLARELAVARSFPAGSAGRDASARLYNQRRLSLSRRFPARRERVLGSRFGNVNRAFEDYPEAAYGAFGVTTWPRLSAVIPASFQSVLSDARAQVDCFVNTTFLALAFAAISVGHWFWDGAAAVWRDWSHTETDFWLAIRETAAHANWLALAVAVAALGVGRAAYELALSRAEAFGEQVRAAFDLYLGSLASQLGYDLPQAETDRREVWRLLRLTWTYGQPSPEQFRSRRPPDPPHPPAGATPDGGDEGAAA
jgi:hypothetical protein